MRETVTISLPRSLRERLDQLVQDRHLSRSDVVREILGKYLYRREFQHLRRTMIPHAEAQGIHTDEDVLIIQEDQHGNLDI